MTIQATRDAGALGAYVSGVDLSKPLDDASFEEIHSLFLEHHVICFRDHAHLTSDQQLSFAARFGTIFTHPYVPGIEGYPPIMEIHDPAPTTVAWHSDTTHSKTPPRMTMLLARRVPDYGGDTMFANQHLAYEELSVGMRRLIEGLKAVHKGTELATQEKGLSIAEVSAAHPVVRRHPETGRPALYVNADYTKHFEDMTEEESRPLLEYLYTACSRPRYTWRHHWRAGDLLMWDNASVQHCVVNDVAKGQRSLHRATIEGMAPA
jgi:taurine dioxygenase